MNGPFRHEGTPTVVVVGLGGKCLPHESVSGEIVDAFAQLGDVALDLELDVRLRVPTCRVVFRFEKDGGNVAGGAWLICCERANFIFFLLHKPNKMLTTLNSKDVGHEVGARAHAADSKGATAKVLHRLNLALDTRGNRPAQRRALQCEGRAVSICGEGRRGRDEDERAGVMASSSRSRTT
jgi:hypothetical protein